MQAFQRYDRFVEVIKETKEKNNVELTRCLDRQVIRILAFVFDALQTNQAGDKLGLFDIIGARFNTDHGVSPGALGLD